MNIFQHVGKPAIIAAYCMQKLHAIIAHETTALDILNIKRDDHITITDSYV